MPFDMFRINDGNNAIQTDSFGKPIGQVERRYDWRHIGQTYTQTMIFSREIKDIVLPVVSMMM